MRIREIGFSFLVLIVGCSPQKQTNSQENNPFPVPKSAFIQVLGTAQDAGYPQADCKKDCCKMAWKDPKKEEKVVSLGLIDPHTQNSYIFDSSPDFPRQLEAIKSILPSSKLSGIFLTHAHIGHYTGLMYLGHEVMGAKEVPVYVMPRMQEYLSKNGPWDQMVQYKNISLQGLRSDSLIAISDSLFIKPLLVPHRDEYSETVGYMIYGPRKKAFFLPDIDKWSKWETDIREIVKEVDYAFLDATFYANGEIPGRDMSQIPHPFVEESMALFEELLPTDKAKIYFIHFNHTNPLIQPESKESQTLRKAGFNIAREGLRFSL